MNEEEEQAELLERRRMAAAHEKTERSDLTAVMRTAEGRRFMWRLLSEAGVFRLSYLQDSDGTAFNEGKRRIGLWTYAQLESGCPELFLQMQSEAAKAAQVERNERPSPSE